MSVERLIDLIAERGLLAPKLVEKLRLKVAEADQPMTAETLTSFLVRKQHLTQQQAQELLDAGMTFEPLPLTAFEENDGSSSIFGPAFVPPAIDDAAGLADEEVFTLIPIEDEAERSADDEPLIPEPMLHVRQLAPEDAFSAETPAYRAAAEVSTVVTTALPPVKTDTSSVRAAPSLKKKKKKKNQWDSPLLLIGGGVLMLLIVCGMTVALIISRRGGDEKLAEARRYRDAGAFAQAISAYQEFITGYPRDESWNKARMELSLAKIRQAVEAGGSFEPALQIAQTDLAALESDTRFDQLPQARPELAELLPQIARGLAQQAGRSNNPAEAQRLAGKAVEALDLCRNAKFVSKDLRDDAALAEVEAELARVSRRQLTRGELSKTIDAMKAAVNDGNPREAYAAREQLLALHPELAGDEVLQAAILEAAKAERDSIQFVAEEQAAETSERTTPWLTVLTTANRQSIAPAAGKGTFVARIDGAIYAFDVTDGRLLWRRYAGFAVNLPPQVVNGRVLVFDAQRQELLSLEERSGKLDWRQEFGESIASPLEVDGRIFVAAPSGKLYVLDVASGKRLGYLQFAQPLKVTPLPDRAGKNLLLVGDHSSIYTVSLADLNAIGVYYLGHSAGSITQSPAQVLNRLAVLENDGVATSRLRILGLDTNSVVSGQVTERRLLGLAASPPLVDSRRLIVVTNRGELDAFDVGSGDGADALIQVAKREPTSREPLVRHTLMTQGAIWVGDNQLTKYDVLPTGDRLPVQSLENSFVRSTFDHPLALFGQALVHVRRVDGRAGATVTAIDVSSGRVLWNNELGVPPAAAPLVDPENRAMVLIDVNGLSYRFEEAALRTRVQDQPMAPFSRTQDSVKLTTGIDLGAGRGAFAAPRESNEVVVYDAADARSQVKRIKLPATVVCQPAPLGQGVLVPLEIGQVLWLDPSSTKSPPLVFQPRLVPGKKIPFQPPGQVGDNGRQFVITDGLEKIYLVERSSDSISHFNIAQEQNVGAFPIVSPLVVLGESAFAAIDGGQLLRFALPSLERLGQTDLPGDVVAGPYPAGGQLLVVTARDQLVAVSAEGAIVWVVPLSAGDLAGVPCVSGDEVLLAYKEGILERRSLADGQVAGSVGVEQPLAAGPVKFLERVVLATHDGSLLVVPQP